MSAMYPCHWEGCSKIFTKKSSKVTHYRKEHLGIRYPCHICDKEFYEKRSRDNHVIKYHDGLDQKTERIPCPDCDLTFALKQGLQKHIRNKHGIGPVTCPECGITKDNNDRLEYHIKITHRNGSFTCCVCGETRASKQNLKTHMLSKHPGYKEDEVTPEEKPSKRMKTNTKINDGIEFLIGIQSEFKDTLVDKNADGNAICFMKGCYGTRLSYGKRGGDKVSCHKHKDEHPLGELINLSDLRLCIYKDCLSKGCITIRDSPKYHFCKHHIDQLEFRGLEKEFVIRTKNPTICKYEECKKCSSFDGKKYCVVHSISGNSDDTRKCSMMCCVDGGPRPCSWHPEYKNKESEFYKKRICSFARRVLIEDAIMSNDPFRVGSLLGHFQMDKVLTLNAQSAFRFECESRYHKELFDCVTVNFDGHVHEGRKTLESKRPDIFYKWVINGEGFGIHIEYDEDKRHEDDDKRLEIIEKDSGCEGRVYIIRVYAGHDTKDPVCSRNKPSESYEYYRVTRSGKEICKEVSDLVKERIDWIRNGVYPTDKNKKIVIY